MKKPFILLLYGTALFWILRSYYKDPSNTGMPTPRTLSAPTYLYGILSLVSDFTGGFTVPLAAGLTVGLIWQVQAKDKSQLNQNRINSDLRKNGVAYVGPSGPSKTKLGPGPGMYSAPPTPSQIKSGIGK
jgi:hypothetical protein